MVTSPPGTPTEYALLLLTTEVVDIMLRVKICSLQLE